MRALILLVACVIVLLGAYGAGFYSGRAGRKRAIATATADIRPVVVASRNLASLNWLSDPSEAELRRAEMKYALDVYDENQRKALL